MKRICRAWHLTPEEIEKDRKIRALVEEEKPEIDARILRRMAAVRRAEHARHGTETLGQRIRAAREGHALTQVELAAAARISQGYLSQLEQDEREPTLAVAARIARVLEMSLDEMAAAVG